MCQYDSLNIAIFGGTFDPIHQAHIAVARAARDRFALDRVLLIPNAVPPHKQGSLGASFEERLEMVRLACEGETAMEASALEQGTARSYSADTIAKVRASLTPRDRLFFVIGADAFAEIGTWYRTAEVLAAVDFIVVARPGHTFATPAGARVYPLDSVHLDVSSSDIREKLAQGEPPPDLAPAVFDYIRAHRLYGFGTAR